MESGALANGLLDAMGASNPCLNPELAGVGTVVGTLLTAYSVLMMSCLWPDAGADLGMTSTFVALAYMLAGLIGVLQGTLTRIDLAVAYSACACLQLAAIWAVIYSADVSSVLVMAIGVSGAAGNALFIAAWSASSHGTIHVFWGFGMSATVAANAWVGYGIPGVGMLLSCVGGLLGLAKWDAPLDGHDAPLDWCTTVVMGVFFMVPLGWAATAAALTIHYNGSCVDLHWTVGQVLAALVPLAALMTAYRGKWDAIWQVPVARAPPQGQAQQVVA
jgi:hypothetical protein